MTDDDENAPWAEDVIAFFRRNLPMLENGDFWHMHITAYQIGCEVLGALGQVKETDWGAQPLVHPKLPDILPRHDDICVAVLKLAEQRGLISYRPSEALRASGRLSNRSFEQEASMPPSNISSAYGLGPAYADPEVQLVLQRLGLVHDGAWTASAETILWRVEPSDWGLRIADDWRFAAALERATNMIPTDIGAELAKLTSTTRADIRKNTFALSILPGSVPERLAMSHTHDLDWLFYQNWRLPDGWLTSEQRMRALAIFHDPLAVKMRRAFVKRLFPNQPGLSS